MFMTISKNPITISSVLHHHLFNTPLIAIPTEYWEAQMEVAQYPETRQIGLRMGIRARVLTSDLRFKQPSARLELGIVSLHSPFYHNAEHGSLNDFPAPVLVAGPFVVKVLL